MSWTRLPPASITGLVMAMAVWLPGFAQAADFTLNAVHSSIVRDFTTVRHLTADTLAGRLKQSGERYPVRCP